MSDPMLIAACAMSTASAVLACVALKRQSKSAEKLSDAVLHLVRTQTALIRALERHADVKTKGKKRKS